MKPSVAVLREERILAGSPLHHEDHAGLHAQLFASPLRNLGDDEAADGVAQQGEAPRVHGVLERQVTVLNQLVQPVADRLFVAVSMPRELVHRDLYVGGRVVHEDEPVLREAIGDAVDAEEPEHRAALHHGVAIQRRHLLAGRLRQVEDVGQAEGPCHQRENVAGPRLVVDDNIALHLLASRHPVLDLIFEVIEVHSGSLASPPR
mmetsp:Transcript_27213/g.55011  ORF Transcript_27213/g.55011 Transcript_27213/m.55011 type:complete len:205 (+) Transcript_27213:542-1156(+)